MPKSSTFLLKKKEKESAFLLEKPARICFFFIGKTPRIWFLLEEKKQDLRKRREKLPESYFSLEQPPGSDFYHKITEIDFY